MKKLMCLAIVLLGSAFLIAAVTYVDSTGKGTPRIQPQVVAAVPSQPYACDVNQRGRLLYVDDTDDTAESYLCFCGVDADDATYAWLKVEDPATDCF